MGGKLYFVEILQILPNAARIPVRRKRQGLLADVGTHLLYALRRHWVDRKFAQRTVFLASVDESCDWVSL